MRLTYTGPIRANYLMDDLLAAFPAWRGTLVYHEGLGREVYQDPLLRVSTVGDTVILDVPEGADPAAVNAIVAAHDPTERVSERSRRQKADYDLVKAKGEADPAWAALTRLLKVLREGDRD